MCVLGSFAWDTFVELSRFLLYLSYTTQLCRDNDRVAVRVGDEMKCVRSDLLLPCDGFTRFSFQLPIQIYTHVH